MATILVTGITGTVMGSVSALLLEKGHTIVALVRPSKQTSPAERLQKILDVSLEARQRIFIIPGDIKQPLAGVSMEDQKRWQGKVDLAIHGAASTKFFETPDRDIHQTNVVGTQQVLSLAEVLGIPAFHHLSTVFVGGDAQEFNETEVPPQKGRNPYEQSKIEAEAIVRGSSLRTSIYRLSIVVGDSRTGATPTFFGYYGCAEPFWRLLQSILQHKERWSKDGVSIGEDGSITLPLSIPCSSVGPLHVAPIDWDAQLLANLVGIPAEGKTFHVVHPDPPKVSDAFAIGLRFLGFRGITCGNTRVDKTGPVTSSRPIQTIQVMIERALRPYASYISLDKQRFGDEVLRETLRVHGKEYPQPPALNKEFFERLLSFAIEKNFGATSGE